MKDTESQVYANQWRMYNPRDKLLFVGFTLVLGAVSSSFLQAVPIILGLGLLLVLLVKASPAVYLKFMAVPASFIIAGVMAVAVSISMSPENMICYFSIGTRLVGISGAGLDQALLILGRSLSTVSCLAFLVLTTPVEDVTDQLERWRFPHLLIELMILVYRFTYIFGEQALRIKGAQSARLGYIDMKTSMRSMSLLLSSLFVQVIARSNSLYDALVARGYNNSLRVLKEEYTATPKSIIMLFIIFDTVLLMLFLY